MPPKPIIVPNGSAPTDLIPDPDANMIAGLNIVPARTLGGDAFNLLVYGYPGVGKTTILGMFAAYPPAAPVLIVDAEGGCSVLAHLDNVDVVTVKSWGEVEKILKWLESTPRDKIKYNTIGFDNMTEFHLMHLRSLTGSAAPQIQDYGSNTATTLQVARRVRDLSRFKKLNTVMLAWQDVKEDKHTGLIRQMVAMTDKLATRFPGVPNNVGHLTVENNPPLYTRKLSFAVSPTADAKFRRSGGSDPALQIPDEIYYGVNDNPIADMLATIFDGQPFPASKYVRPKRGAKVAASSESEE